MYELIQLSERTYYIKSPTNIGLVRLDEQNVCLIDSGNDKDAGRKARQILDANGWNLAAIYNTHAHADHIGGNKYLQGQTGCKVYAPGIDCDFTRHPILEPSLLYGGYPPKDLRHKFLMAQESDAEELTTDKLPNGFEAIKLPGHFFNMVGFRTPDHVVFLADCLSSREILDKYQIGFVYDVAAYVKYDDHFSAMNNFYVADDIERINRKFLAEGKNYVLIGPGRWGSSDHYLGVPVKWPHISAARVIVEVALKNYNIDPSQGTHFFQNLTSFGVGYFTVDTNTEEGGFVNKEILDAMPAVEETPYVRHVRFAHPMRILMDGKKQEGAVLIPKE